MNSSGFERNRQRFSRVSRTRIFDGHPLKPDVYTLAVMVLTSVSISAAISTLFSYLYDADYFMVLWSLAPGTLLGFALLILERSLSKLKNTLFPQMGKLLTGFLLFFVHIIGYLALSSLVLNYPVGLIMEKTGYMDGMATEYSLFSVNFFIVLGLLSWLRNARSGPNPCF